MTDWLNKAVRAAVRRQNAAAYIAWETATTDSSDVDALTEVSNAVALDGAEW